jgi:transcription elongation factor GreB
MDSPTPKSPTLRPISAAGMEKLRSEWEDLYREQRPKLLIEIADAAAQGDRSENAEYIYGKKKLREIDKRLRQLNQMMDGCQIVEGHRKDPDLISFGARVLLLRDDAKTMLVQIVGKDEIDPIEGKISMDSPIGKALMGRSKGESIQVETPRGLMKYSIQTVEYD